MTRTIDLSCDLGEAVSEGERAVESEIWPLVSAANIACGGHVGDEESMRKAIERCAENGVVLGAHPSYPDREGFGRRHIAIRVDELIESLEEQIATLGRLAAEQGLALERIKPHGALYNEAQRETGLAEAVVAACRATAPRAALVCAPGSRSEEAARNAGLAVVREAFADRRYDPDGSLQPRGEAGALLEDPDDTARQAVSLSRSGTVLASDGRSVRIPFDTLCVHSDMKGAVDRIRRVREALAEAGFTISRRK